MKELIDKNRIESIKNMNFDDNLVMVSRRLIEVHDIFESKYGFIQYQKAEVEESKQDYDAPSEGLHPGYDNGIRISPVKTCQLIKRCVGEINEYSVFANDTVKRKKNNIISDCDRTEEKLRELNRSDRVINEKEQVLVEMANILEETVELFELMDKLDNKL
jgi:hypothetical protein